MCVLICVPLYSVQLHPGTPVLIRLIIVVRLFRKDYKKYAETRDSRIHLCASLLSLAATGHASWIIILMILFHHIIDDICHEISSTIPHKL